MKSAVFHNYGFRFQLVDKRGTLVGSADVSQTLNAAGDHRAGVLVAGPLDSSVSTPPLAAATGGLDIAAFLYTTSGLPVFMAA
jgi:hypothetical protein